MKKLIISLSSITIAAVTSTSVISCVAPKYAVGPVGQRIMFVTDGGNIRDKSFNEGAHNSIIKYTKEIDDWNNTKGFSYDGTQNYVESSGDSSASLLAAYKMAKFRESDALVLAGFKHTSIIESASKLMGNKTIILADGVADYGNGGDFSKPATKNKNVISLQFNSELAGFAAGYDASVWANKNQAKADANGDKEIRVGMFAGMSNKFSVDNYMWGMIAGLHLFNKLHADEISNGIFKEMKLANNYDKGVYKPIENTSVTSSSDAGWFSNSFDLGGASKSGIVDKLVSEQKADIVFPVAGVQIEDVLAYNGANYKPLVIGVDTDQANSYPGFAGRFITSATKNLEQAITDELRRSASLKTAIDSEGKLIEGLNSKDVHNGNKATSPVDDGTIAKVNPNWSESTKGGLNMLKEGYVKFELNSDSKAETENDNNKFLMNTIIDEFSKTGGPDASQYIKGSTIVQLVERLMKDPNELAKFVTKATAPSQEKNN